MATHTGFPPKSSAQAGRARQMAEYGANPLPSPSPAKLKHHFLQTEQGLNFQPFIFAIAACIPDLEAKNKQDLHDVRPGDYRDGGTAIAILKQSLSRAGFAFTGTRLSSSPVKTAQIYEIAERAAACTDRLIEHFQHLHPRQEPDEAHQLRDRVAAFQGATEEISAHRDIARYQAEAAERARLQRIHKPIDDRYMCALK